MKKFPNFLKWKSFWVFIVILAIFLLLWYKPGRNLEIDYGVTFSDKYSKELGLNPKDVLRESLDDLGIKKFRLVAYWNDIQVNQNTFDYSNLDWQLDMIEKNNPNAEVILSIGRRVPRWPECHVPDWVLQFDEQAQQKLLLEYLEETINRYKDHKIIKIWQVENEPFFTSYAQYFCGKEIDKDFYDEELSFVKELDPTRPIITTDSGEMGLWSPAYKRGDYFGTTFYVYLANQWVKDFRTWFTYNYYNYKYDLMSLLHGPRRTYLIEISLEPWLLQPIFDTSIEEQLMRMNPDRIKNVIEMAGKTKFTDQYLWGLEWWYYLKEKGRPEIWNYLRELYN